MRARLSVVLAFASVALFTLQASAQTIVDLKDRGYNVRLSQGTIWPGQAVVNAGGKGLLGYIHYVYAGLSEGTMHIEMQTSKDDKYEPSVRLMLPMKNGEAVLFIKHWTDVPAIRVRLKLNPDTTITGSLMQ